MFTARDRARIKEEVVNMFKAVIDAETIPGATKKECGNYKLHNLQLSKAIASKFLKEMKNMINASIEAAKEFNQETT